MLNQEEPFFVVSAYNAKFKGPVPPKMHCTPNASTIEFNAVENSRKSQSRASSSFESKNERPLSTMGNTGPLTVSV